MHSMFTNRRAGALLLLGAVAMLLLLMWAADSALGAPRSGITYARGVPAELEAAVPRASTQSELSGASLAPPPGSTTQYLVLAWPVTWIIGAVGAVVLLGAARAYALGQRRGRCGRLAELTGRRPESIGSRSLRSRDDARERRKAA